MSKPEQLGQEEYSQREILEEIFIKFAELKSQFKLGETAHLVMDRDLYVKLRDRLPADQFGYTQAMPISTEDNINQSSSLSHTLAGEVFSLFPPIEGVIPLSAISLSLVDLKMNFDSKHSIYLGQLRDGSCKLKAQTTLEKI